MQVWFRRIISSRYHAQHTVHFIVFLYFSCKPPDFIALINALINLIN